MITSDIKTFADHIDEMLNLGVEAVLNKYGYECSHNRDKEFLTSWLEVLVLLRKLSLDIDDVRRLLGCLTWSPSTGVIMLLALNGLVVFHRFEGTLTLNGVPFEFTPFPKWKTVNTPRTLSLNPQTH
ncbi:hypothetical protein V2G26_004564 [Clonostachys chloroleuca]